MAPAMRSWRTGPPTGSGSASISSKMRSEEAMATCTVAYSSARLRMGMKKRGYVLQHGHQNAPSDFLAQHLADAVPQHHCY